MPEYRKDPVVAIAGRVGKDPTRRDTRSGTVVGFSVAVTTGYDDSDLADWYDISVFNEGLQESVLAEISKGSSVAIEGFFSTREYQGKTYKQITGNRVGLVEYLARSKSAPRQAPVQQAAAPVTSAPASGPTVEQLQAQLAALRATQAQEAAPAADLDDLPF